MLAQDSSQMSNVPPKPQVNVQRTTRLVHFCQVGKAQQSDKTDEHLRRGSISSQMSPQAFESICFQGFLLSSVLILRIQLYRSHAKFDVTQPLNGFW